MRFQGETIFYFCNQADFFLLLLWKQNTFDEKNVVCIRMKSKMSSAMYILFLGPLIINVFWPPPWNKNKQTKICPEIRTFLYKNKSRNAQSQIWVRVDSKQNDIGLIWISGAFKCLGNELHTVPSDVEVLRLSEI